MRTRLLALAATLGIVGFAAASVASATVPSGGGSSGGGGGMSAGGGGHAGGGGGGHFGGGGHGGGGGHFGGGHLGGGYGGANGGSALHAGYLAHGGYIAHGSYLGAGARPARGGYRIVGSESVGIAHISSVPRGGHDARITLALGPRTGSAATAMRLDHMNRIHPRLGHPPGPNRPNHHPKHMTLPYSYTQDVEYGPRFFPFFCEDFLILPPHGEPIAGCPQPLKESVGRKVAVARPTDPSRLPP